MQLLLDAGNSRLKWQLVDDKRKHEGCCAYSDLGCLAELVGATRLDRVLVSSVRGPEFDRELVLASRDQFGIEPFFAVVEQECLGLVAAYDDFRRLGVDRWLAMLAAFHREKSVCVVIDAGTAITADFVGLGGRHQGGLIVPGVQAMTRALLSSTSAIDVKSLTPPQTWRPGCDTLACVEQGVAAALKGLMSEVVAYTDTMAKELPSASAATIYLTGGDMALLRSWLPASAKCESDLVLQGLLLNQCWDIRQ
ncbi:type III pantothenate kinase [Teredinibacter haidensis]|uniref:type III pantothenate kinase n=1 Tax=Teredinibacter haidensis TaxID=2731755 RepID=UPI000948DFF9|nr:type III pantothenate kinase [Teredinibacter haidensis]